MARKSNLEDQLKELDGLRARGVITDEEFAVRRGAVLSAAAPTVVVKKGGFPIFRVGCLAILGIVVVLVIVAAAVGAQSGKNSRNAAPVSLSGGGTPQAGTNSGDVHVALAPNASGEIAPEGDGSRKTRVTILQIVNGVKSGNQFAQPPDGKKWVGFEVLLTNVGTSEVTGMWFKLHDSQDFEHDPTYVVGAGTPLDTLANLTPGGKTQGWVFFEVNASAAVKWLRADPNPFLKNDLYFDAP